METANYDGFSVIGRSPYATTYRAYSNRLQQPVTLKVYHLIPGDALGIDPTATGDTTGRDFLSEVELWASVDSEFLVAPLEAGTSARNEAYVARPRLAAESLAAHLLAGEAFSISRALLIGADVSAAADSLHRFGHVHGAITPNNVFVGEDDHVWLTDPLARIARQLVPEGPRLRPGHIAPEVLAGGQFSEKSDSYSIMSTIADALGHQPLPTPVTAMIDACLSPNPDDRPSPHQLVDLFREAASLAEPTIGRHARTPLDHSPDNGGIASGSVGAVNRMTSADNPLVEHAAESNDHVQPGSVSVVEPTSHAPLEATQHSGTSPKIPPADGATHDVQRRPPSPAIPVLSVDGIPGSDRRAGVASNGASASHLSTSRRSNRRWLRWALAMLLIAALCLGIYLLARNRHSTSTSSETATKSPSTASSSKNGTPKVDQIRVTPQTWFAVAGPRNQRQVVIDFSATDSRTSQPLDLEKRKNLRFVLLVGEMGDYSPPPKSGLHVTSLDVSPAALGLDPPVHLVDFLKAIETNPADLTESFPSPVDQSPLITFSTSKTRLVFYVPQPSEIVALAVLDARDHVLGVAAATDWGPPSDPTATPAGNA